MDMFALNKLLIGATAVAGLAAAAPVSAQYYGYSPYSSYNNYNYNRYNGYSAYGYNNGYAANTSLATQQCEAAVQNRLYNRTSIGGIIGAVLGVNTMNNARVLGVTRVTPSNGFVRVRGIASSGRYALNGYGPYGVGAYGALGYNYGSAADLSFKCDVDYRGYVRNVDINRR
jgi:hypothetical protein